MEQPTSPIPEPAPQTEVPTEAIPEAEIKEPEQPLIAEQPEAPESAAPPDIDSLIAQAEQRGYLKAMNSLAATKMNRPDIWQPEADNTPQVSDDPLAANFLTRRRPCVWD